MTAQLSSHFDETGAQFAWDATSLKWAATCQRYYLFQMLFSFEGPKSVHLIFGGHYAKALERYHQHVAAGKSHDEAQLLAVQSALIDSWVHNLDSTGAPIPASGHAQVFDSPVKSREGLIRTIIWYLEEYLESEITTHVLANGKAAVELSFKVELGNRYIYSGHIDRVVKWGSDFYVQDQKTTGSGLNHRFFTQFDTDIQMSGYSFAGRIIYSIPIRGVMIDGAEIGDGYSRFLRGYTMRDEPLLAEWRATMTDLIDQTRANTVAYRKSNDMSVFPPNYTACGNYGGCSFRSVCSIAPALRERYLRSNFSTRPQWNPLIER